MPLLSPERASQELMEKATWLAGGLLVLLALGAAWWWAYGEMTQDEMDEAAARNDPRYRGWDPDLLKKLRAIKRRGDMLTHQYGENKR